MPNRSFSFISLFVLMVISLFGLMGCSSDANQKDSVSSGTATGFGGSGAAAAHVSVATGSFTISNGGTTPILVKVTDAQGRPTDATIILTSSRGGSFAITSINAATVTNTNTNTTVNTAATTNTVLQGPTVGGSLSTTFTFVAATTSSGTSTIPAEGVATQITAFIVGTIIAGSVTVTITP